VVLDLSPTPSGTNLFFFSPVLSSKMLIFALDFLRCHPDELETVFWGGGLGVGWWCYGVFFVGCFFGCVCGWGFGVVLCRRRRDEGINYNLKNDRSPSSKG